MDKEKPKQMEDCFCIEQTDYEPIVIGARYFERYGHKSYEYMNGETEEKDGVSYCVEGFYEYSRNNESFYHLPRVSHWMSAPDFPQ